MAVLLIASLLYAGAGTAVVSTTHDAWIAGEIEGAYRVHERLNIFDIGIQVEQGVVTLSGELRSELDRETAVELAQGVEGVEQVNDRFTVVRAPEDARQQEP
jgi:hyperosmotically inducible periplasmic protein